ncbi:enkurin [Ictalurus punctatus]|uniref:Enkurin n=1 Tax=Ictalurus punctatus TaxID=7998 RepID=E3TFJ9_ICTPU|nr:enkurin [Ictalurus punctatus]ADO29085.1 enkurin [Ictalurus punctatus]
MSSVMHPPESIYNLIPREEEKIEKAPRYTSRFREQVKEEKKQNKESNKTMGPAKVEMPSPDKYLLKHSRDPKLSEKKPFSYRDEIQPRKPRIPAKTEQPLRGIQTKKDFVRINAVENIMAVPRKPPPAYAHTKHGDKELLENSGLVPKYLKKQDYGQTPEYLSHRQEEVRGAQEEYDRYVKEKMKEGAMKQLSEKERLDILHGLKKNWDELHHQYQDLSVITDTLPKKNRKERLESEMKQLEKDIEMIERFKTIYIGKN